MTGNVMFDSNYDLCYVNSIAWTDILTGQDATTNYQLTDPSRPLRQCKYVVLSSLISRRIYYRFLVWLILEMFSIFYIYIYKYN